MAYRDYDHRGWEDNRHQRSGYNSGNNRDREDRGWFDRAGDEVRSWFGDDDAERRRRMDERRDDMNERRRDRFDYDNGSDYRHNYGDREYNSERVARDLDRDRYGRQEYNRGGYAGEPYRDRGNYQGNQDRGYQGWGGGQGNQGWSNSRGEQGWNGGQRMSGGQEWRGGEHPNWNGGRSGSAYDRGGSDYNRGDYDSDRARYGNDRGSRDWSDRAGDEVRSWLGDDRAEQRRRMDDRRGDYNDNDRRDTGMW